MYSRQIVIAWLVSVCFHSMSEGDDKGLTFERDIRPIFREHCYDCHGATSDVKGKLDLRLVRLMKVGGDSGPAINMEKPAESYLLERVKSGEMPPGENRLSNKQVRIIETWLKGGAKTARAEPASIPDGLGVTPEERSYWFFQPIKRPKTPSFSAAARVRTPIDALILDEMPRQSPIKHFAKDADRLTLIKRAYFTLVGLGPSPAEVSKWMTDKNPEWYNAMLDELLDSPHYGERWARHWLDTAGYADSEGYTTADSDRAWAWKYRDWVIKAFNDDMPFDQFVTEQLAGDELAGPRQGDLSERQISLITATGFLRMAADGTDSGADNAEGRNQVVTDTVRIVATTMLGLSVHCAQCHDHRYDPIPQADFYSLRAIFEPALDWKAWKRPRNRVVSLYTDADRKKAAEIEKQAAAMGKVRNEKQAEYMAQALKKELTKYDEPLKGQLEKAYKTPANKRTSEQKELFKKYPSLNINPGNLYQYIPESRTKLKEMDDKIKAKRAEKPVEEFLRCLVEDPGKNTDTFLFYRGDHKQPKQKVAPAGLTISAAEGKRLEFLANDTNLPTTGRRLAFAKFLTSGEHPLFARVIVNRVWMHHFGKGIVSTAGDFGKLGTKPTHPKLLDWLAAEFMQSGWSLKRLHRTIMRSTVYRQEGEVLPAKNETSEFEGPVETTELAELPIYQTYIRKPLMRLDAEIVRDRMLAASGVLDRKLYGRPVNIKADFTGQIVIDGTRNRRSIYTKVKRSQPVAIMKAFDAPVMDVNCEYRPVSTVATQSLMLMNSDFILQQAEKLAARASAEAKPVAQEIVDEFAQLPNSLQSNWQYGYAEMDFEKKQLRGFHRLPLFTADSWRGGTKLPDAKTGWALISPTGGHPGSKFAVVRRWQAPSDGVVDIDGKLHHPSDNGNGVRGWIIVGNSDVKGTWVVKTQEIKTQVQRLNVKKGTIIDFVVDANEGNVTSDTFSWVASIKLSQTDGKIHRAGTKDDFHGPIPSVEKLSAAVQLAWQLALCRKPSHDEIQLAATFLSKQINFYRNNPAGLRKNITAQQQALTNLCQGLLSCNEFLYVD